MICDKIVLGVANVSTRRRLLRGKELTLATSIEMYCAAELTDIRMRAMEIYGPPHTEAVHAIARQQSRQNQSRQSNSPRTVESAHSCKYCGNSHARGREHCPAFGKQRKPCGTHNHLAKVCQKSKRRPTDGKVNCLENTTEHSEQNSDEDIYMH